MCLCMYIFTYMSHNYVKYPYALKSKNINVQYGQIYMKPTNVSHANICLCIF